MNSSALFLSAEAPYPLAGGGALRSASLLSFLARDYAVDLITFREPSAPDPRLHLPPGLARRVHVIELPVNARHSLARLARNAGRLVRRVPPLMDRFAGFGSRIAEAIDGRHYDLAIVEHFWCAPYCEPVAAASDITVLDLHNIESVWHARSARAAHGAPALAHRAFQNFCRRLEERWLPRFTYLLAASEADAEQLRHISPGSTISVYPNSIPLTPPPPRIEEDLIVFSGNLEYHPNVGAVRYFRDEIWPALRAHWPGLVWRLIGKNPQTVAKIVSGDDRIQLSGPVDDALLELARAKVAIVPLLAGSGTRVKIIEAWAAGVPVVSTSLGAEGLPSRAGDNIVLADGAPAFRDAVSALLSNPPLRDRIGRAGRYQFEREFTWEAAWKRLHFLYPANMVRS
ncbi:MAG TPA: glycosyltransferase family 4 protein [Bryobacteraceae bacterium]|nr:glycosyltransferase family 4 protein [Bryobacteraceae bacterium]